MTTTSPKAGNYRWVVAVMFFMVYMIAGADRANIGVVVPFIKNEYHLTNTDIGMLACLFYITYAAVQIPSGFLFNKFGIGRILSGCIILTSLSTLLIGFTTSVLQLKIARALLGAAEGPLNIGIVSIINRWFPAREKGLATGIFMSSIKFAPAFVPPLCAFIVFNWGWREVFYIFAVPGFIIAGLWLFLVKDDPSKSKFCSESERGYILNSDANERALNKKSGVVEKTRFDFLIRARRVEKLSTSRQIFASWNNWACAVGYGLMVGITYSIMTWIPTYLVNVKHLSILSMGFVASAPWLGAIVGNILGGMMSDCLFRKRRKPVMFITSASTVVMMYLLIITPSVPALIAALFFITGVLLNIGYSTFLVYPMGLVEKEKVPLAVSVVNTVGSVGGAVAPFVVGLILDSGGWDQVFIFLSISSLFAFMLLITMTEPLEKEHTHDETVVSTEKHQIGHQL
ncbi:MFS transporter [Pantoea agglomerans]|uniref:MFS transporter n=1 Tax=Enterobacter agglomerans TaxID=549 RepID=UPI000F01BDA7|nr:MFS transporter [Pantoea agglomerans]AYP25785.1 MFS transporter [Pantoea agglomerans]